MADDLPIPLAELKDRRHIEDAKSAMRELIKRVPRDFGYADELALLFPAMQASGAKSSGKTKKSAKRRGGRS